MSTNPRHIFLHDDLEEFSSDQNFRIPPLQGPLPYIPYERPHPLEPNAFVNGGAPLAELPSRRSKALADAKGIGDEELHTLNEAGEELLLELGGMLGLDNALKRQKLNENGETVDFVQLPKPKAKPPVERLPPFKPVPILNELHEPPPSAALFPPIIATTHDPGSTSGRARAPRRPRRPHPGPRPRDVEPQAPTTADQKLAARITTRSLDTELDGPKRRICLRPRRNWTVKETEFLLHGVSIYGVGKWKKILHHVGFTFHPERTTVDLKDRYRTVRLIGDKALENQALRDRALDHPFDFQTKAQNEDSDFNEPSTLLSAPDPTRVQAPKVKTKRKRNIFGPPPAPRKLAPRWTKEEDSGLAKGYRKYGFQWTTISQDPEFGLRNRTGKQVRDRFRIKFPVHYSSSVPIPLTEKERHHAQVTDRLKFPLDLLPKRTLAEEMTAVLTGPYTSPGATRIATGNSKDHGSGLMARKLEEEDKRITADARNSPCDGRSRHSSFNGDERGGHLGIMGLLNDEVEEHARGGGRLPAVRFPLEEWPEDDLSLNNTTLRPLLWEDMAARPMFELE